MVNQYDKYKIGFTTRSVDQRTKELQTGSDSKLSVVHVYESELAKEIETVLHRNFAHKRMEGEWFALDPDDVLKFKDRCKQVERNLNLVREYRNEAEFANKRII